jgi:hypothetical protein
VKQGLIRLLGGLRRIVARERQATISASVNIVFLVFVFVFVFVIVIFISIDRWVGLRRLPRTSLDFHGAESP